MIEPNRIQSAVAEAMALTHDSVGVTARADGYAELRVTDHGAPAPGGAGYGTSDRTYVLLIDGFGRPVRR